MNIRSERRTIRVDGKEQERRVWVRIDSKNARLTRSESLPNIRRERVRNARVRDIDVRDTRQRALERNDRKILENRSDERIFRRQVRDRRYELQTNRENMDKIHRTAYTRQVIISIFIMMYYVNLNKKKHYVYRMTWFLLNTKMLQLHGKFSLTFVHIMS